MRKTFEKLTRFFEGDRKKAFLVIILFAVGIFSLIASNVIRLVHDGDLSTLQKILFKLAIDLPWFCAALLGTRQNPTKRNTLLIPTLLAYMIGDCLVHIKIVLGGAFYAIGHILMLATILETTYIRRWQWITFFVSCLIPVIVVFVYGEEPLLMIVLTLYGIIIAAVMSFSLTSRYFRMAGIVFALSDLGGILRFVIMNNNFTYILTTLIYFNAMYLLCISVFSVNYKEVVLWGDLFSLLKRAKFRNVPLWVCGRWSKSIVRHDKKFSYERLDMAYDIANRDAFEELLRMARYHRIDPSKDQSLYYSESYGKLKVYPCTFGENGTARMSLSSGAETELDSGFFSNVNIGTHKVPMIVPTSADLLRTEE